MFFQTLPSAPTPGDCADRTLIIHDTSSCTTANACGAATTRETTPSALNVCRNVTPLETQLIEYAVGSGCDGWGVVKITVNCPGTCP
jgi:hypothetical protein